MNAFPRCCRNRSPHANATVCPDGQGWLLRWTVLVLVILSPFGTFASAIPPAPECRTAAKREVLTNYCDLLHRAYLDSHHEAAELLRAVELLVSQPSEETLGAARAAWLRARVPYGQTEVARFYDGPIDQRDGRINAWPVDESYMDYVQGRTEAGIINLVEAFPVLTGELLSELNEQEGEKNISSGFHAIEFLLWGQDLSPDAPGARPWTDYAATGRNADRRGTFLRLTARTLEEDLRWLAGTWAGGDPENYRAEFLSLDSDLSLGMILKGAGALSGPELSGERLMVAYVTKEQENEQSCFSDSTHVDVIQNALGVENVYLGRYVDRTGKLWQGRGVRALLSEYDPELAESLARQISGSVEAARLIPAPFDTAMMGGRTSPGRQAIKAAAASLQTQSEMMARAARVMGLDLGLEN